MKNLLVMFAALAVIVCLVGSVSAAEKTMSTTTLSSLGLSGMTQMSDAAGMEIRGKGFSSNYCRPTYVRDCAPKPVCYPKPICRPTYCNPCKVVCYTPSRPA